MAASPKEGYLHARQLWQNGKLEEAQEEYLRLIDTYPAFPHPWYDLAAMYDPSNPKRAVVFYETFIQLASSRAALVKLMLEAQKRINVLRTAPNVLKQPSQSISMQPVGGTAVSTIGQEYLLSSAFPAEYIKKRYEQGAWLTKLLCTPGQQPAWFCLTSTATRTWDQCIQVFETMQPAEIYNAWFDKGWVMEDLTFDGNKWHVLFGMKEEGVKYGLSFNIDFPVDQIKEGWDRGFDLCRITYTNSCWYVFWKSGLNFQPQKCARYDEKPIFRLERLVEATRQDGFITNVAHAAGSWLVVHSKGAQILQQVYISHSIFPNTQIVDYWKQGFNITSVAFGNNLWFVVMSK